MKTRSLSRHQDASTIFLTLVIAGVVGLTLAAYLSWANSQNTLAMRSQRWNAALPVAEAGLEEALTQLHYNGVTNLSANGWTVLTNSLYYKRNYVDGSSYYEVTIKNVDPPVIVSTGCVPAPLGSATTPYVKRRIQVNTTASGSSLGAAIIAKEQIFLSGNNVTIDSFDSTDPLHSTLGKYDPLKAKAQGDVLTNAGDGVTSNGKPLYALEVGDADIKGHVATGPSGTVDVTAGGTVGDSAWVTAATPGIEPGWASHDANVAVDDVQPPFSGGYFTPSGITIGKVKYTYNLDQSANYKLSILSGKLLVTGNATLWVTDDVNIGTGDFIQIAPGASLRLYVSAPSAVIGGQGIVNTDGYAKNFQYYGLPTNTSIDYKGNASFVGTIKAPQATLKLGGGGTSDYDFIGSAVVRALTMNGHFHIHYDEAVLNAQSHEYGVSAWNEVDPNAPLN